MPWSAHAVCSHDVLKWVMRRRRNENHSPPFALAVKPLLQFGIFVNYYQHQPVMVYGGIYSWRLNYLYYCARSSNAGFPPSECLVHFCRSALKKLQACVLLLIVASDCSATLWSVTSNLHPPLLQAIQERSEYYAML
jgi:hypothetical protein